MPADPDAGARPGRRDQLIAGMKIWFNDPTLKDRGIKIDVTGTEPAANDPNVVRVKWDDAGTLKGDELGEGGPKWDPNTKDADGNHTAVGGEIEIDRGVTSTNEIYNLGAHEMGHVLGCGHGDNPIDVMYPIIRKDDKLTLSSRNDGKAGDVAELKATYAANGGDSKINFVAQVFPVGPDFLYQYTATWVSGGPLAVFQVDTHGAGIFDILPANGWMVDNFLQPDDWLDLRTSVGTEVFLGFVHQSDDFNLREDNPVLTFSFKSSRAPGTTEAFFNGEFETVGPMVVPEPTGLSLLATGLAILLALIGDFRYAYVRTLTWTQRRVNPMKPLSLLLLAVAMVGCTAAAWAQPSGLQITGFIPGPGCPQGTSISTISWGRSSIEFLDKFDVGPNQGRIQCMAKLLVSVPAGYQFTFADYKQNNAPSVPLQSAQAMFSGRLNGTTSRALVDLSWTIPAATPVTLNQSYTYSDGSVTWPSGSLGDFVFPAGTTFPFSACASQVTTRTVLVTIDAAAASNYVIPWPPPPVGQNEKFYVNGIRFGVKWQPCTP